MKTCTKCGINKPDHEFPWRKKDVKRNTRCKVCISKYHKKHYKENKDRYINRSKVQNQKVYKERSILICEYLENNPCSLCGESDILVLEFHHREPEYKDFVISKGRLRASESSLMAELDKCDVLCANCHARLHSLEIEDYKYRYLNNEL